MIRNSTYKAPKISQEFLDASLIAVSWLFVQSSAQEFFTRQVVVDILRANWTAENGFNKEWHDFEDSEAWKEFIIGNILYIGSELWALETRRVRDARLVWTMVHTSEDDPDKEEWILQTFQKTSDSIESVRAYHTIQELARQKYHEITAKYIWKWTKRVQSELKEKGIQIIQRKGYNLYWSQRVLTNSNLPFSEQLITYKYSKDFSAPQKMNLLELVSDSVKWLLALW